jgi:hypothetical protein
MLDTGEQTLVVPVSRNPLREPAETGTAASVKKGTLRRHDSD